MFPARICRCGSPLLAVLSVVAIVFLLGAQPPAAPKVSSFAPASDVVKQFDYYFDRLDNALESQEDYDESYQNRVRKDASTITVLLLALGLNDQESPLKASASALLPLAQKLAKSAKDFETARAAYDELAKARKAGISGGGPLAWTVVAEQEQLMKQVTTLNARIRRAVRRESSFGRYAEKTAGYATTMAVIAQASLTDVPEVKDPAHTDKWYQWASEWRDAAGSVGQGARAGDFELTSKSVKRMLKSCDDCHEVFRKEGGKETEQEGKK